ncbi:hypothetical protein M8J76_013675 [Diaphorina citri]|nr:hypothetical protein M8J75_015234 [Diaphorina citri]KAI5722792.1 hypothetical protein M8J76_013675 [Diaphorina citri]
MNSADEKEIQEYTKNLGIEYRFGCYSEKNPDACHLLGDFLDAIQKDPEKAMKVYKANCDESGYGRSCFQYGRLLMRDKNFSDEEKMTLTPPYFERGCQSNHAESCVMNGIGMLARAAGNTDTSLYPRALENFKKGCELNNPLGCFQASGILLMGIEKASMPPNKPVAFEYAVKACDLHDLRGCVNASIMCRKGDGIPVDEKKAEEFKARAIEIQKMYKEENQGIGFQQGI